MRRALAIALFAVLAEGCNCGGPTTPKDLYHGLVDSLCSYEARCGGIGKSEEAKCTSNGDAYVDKYLIPLSSYDIDAAIAAHRLSIDSSASQKCLDAYKNLQCSGITTSSVSACRDVYKGGVALGGMCQSSFECQGGFCKFASATGSCNGTCAAYTAENAACASTVECDPKKDFCSIPTGTAMGTCKARGAQGAACTGFDTSQCQDGLACTNSVCSGPSGAGQPCSYSVGCVDGYFCPLTGSSPVCTKRVGTGEACSSPAACPDGNRCVGLSTAGATGVCRAVLDVGAACDPTADACPGDAPCDSVAKKCTPPAGSQEGDSCSTTGPATCQSSDFLTVPLYCDATSMKCTAKLLPGQACTPPASGTGDPCATSCDATSKVCTQPTAYCQ